MIMIMNNRKMKKTIDELAPKWTRFFDLVSEQKFDEAKEHMKLNKLDITSPHYCVLGEIYDWKTIYHNTCGWCEDFAYNTWFKDHNAFLGFLMLGRRMTDAALYKIPEMINLNWRETSTVKEFLKHWNEKHDDAS